MKKTYQFIEKNYDNAYDYGTDAPTVISLVVCNKIDKRFPFSDARSIEERIEKLSEIIGGISELLISKGLMTPQEFLVAIGAKDVYEVTDRKGGF